MSRALLMGIVLMACTWLSQANVTIQYTDCPKDCKCEKKSLGSIMSCRTLFTENLARDMPISKFELSQTDTPIKLTENIFLNMGLKNVNVISIFNTTIESIDKNAFNGLEELSNIKMTHSKITTLHPDTFKNISKLEKLNLAGNPLSKKTVIKSENLEELHLAHCGLSEMSSKLFKYTPLLTFVDLTGNGIEQLSPDTFDYLPNIEEINLSHNKIKQLPKELFSKNIGLDTLDLSYNPLVLFSGKQVAGLETLNLTSCLLKQIDATMFKNMNYLYNLDLSNNKIARIDPLAFEDMHEIAIIDLSGNDLRSVSENLFANNTDIQKINLSNNNKLTKLPIHGFKAPKPSFVVQYFSCNNCNLRMLSKDTFKNMPGLLTLLLSNNKITDISTGVFQNLNSLNKLDLSYNQIKTIDDNTFKNNNNLNKLSLAFNPLKALHASMFKQNENLEFLDISNCGLYQLWTGESNKIRIPSLVSVNASNNNIEIIKKEDIVVTNHVRSLDISNNPLICSSDLKDLIIYLQTEDIKNGEYLTHAKLAYDFEIREKEENGWKDFAKTLCSKLFDDEEEAEIEDELYEENIEVETSDYNGEDGITVTKDLYDDFTYSDDLSAPVTHEIKLRYSYMWPVLVFLGSALIVLGLVANLILFVIRRKQSMPVPISVPRMSRLKKNSGLVYQQLSEEHGSKTPILSRFAPIPSVHGNCPESEHV